MFKCSYCKLTLIPLTYIRPLAPTSDHNSHPPPKKKPSSSSSSSHSSSSSGGSSKSYSGSQGQSSSKSKPPPQRKSAFTLSAAAAVAVAGVAALYHKQNRQIVTAPAHPLAGSVAKRVERFDKMAGQASPQARNGVLPSLDSSYVEMTSTTDSGVPSPGSPTMAMI